MAPRADGGQFRPILAASVRRVQRILKLHGIPVIPGDESTACVQAGSDAIVVAMPVHVVLDVFFPGPHHLDRTRDLLRDLHSPDGEIHLEATAEAPAEEVIVHLDFIRWQTGQLRTGTYDRKAGLNSPEAAAANRSTGKGVPL